MNKEHQPNCPLDQAPMRKGKEAKSAGSAIIVFVIGLILTLTGIGAIIGIPIILYAVLGIAFKRRGLWVCTACGHQVERKIKWNELG